MMLFESLRLALSGIRSNRLRSLLTMLGIIIGISSVITIMTIGNSLTSQMTDAFSDLGTSNISIMVSQRPEEVEIKGEGSLEAGRENYSDVREMTEEDLITREMINIYSEYFKKDLYAVAITQMLDRGIVLEQEKNTANINLCGVNYGSLLSNRLDLMKGRYFSPEEMKKGSPVCIVSDIVVENLFGGDSDKAIGNYIYAYNSSFVITGIYQFKDGLGNIADMGRRKDKNTDIYIPLKTAQVLSHSDGKSGSIDVVPKPGINIDDFAKRTSDFFNTRFYKNNDAYYIESFSLSSIFGTLSTVMTGATAGIAVIAGIALLVGGIGVMNIMLVSITERTKEIGIRKALGATNFSIRMQFIIEAIVICIIGGIIGLILGVGQGLIILKIMKLPAQISIGSIILSISFSTAIGVFFGYYPANKAAKMNPIDALRYE